MKTVIVWKKQDPKKREAPLRWSPVKLSLPEDARPDEGWLKKLLRPESSK